MINMKRYVFIIGLWAVCLILPIVVNAQWGFTISQGQRGNCVGCGDIEITVINIGNIPMYGFSTRQECETVRQQFTGISQSFVCGCVLYIICSTCTGTDIVMNGDEGLNIGSSGNINGTTRGRSFYSANPYESLRGAYDQNRFLYQALFGIDKNGNASLYPQTDDKDYNNQIFKILPKGTLATGRGIEDIDLNATPKIELVPGLSSGTNDGESNGNTSDNYKITQKLYGEGFGEKVTGYDSEALGRRQAEELSELMSRNAAEAAKAPSPFSIDNLPVSDETKEMFGKMNDAVAAFATATDDYIKEEIKSNVTEMGIEIIKEIGKGVSEVVDLAEKLLNFAETLSDVIINPTKEILTGTLAASNGDFRQLTKTVDELPRKTVERLEEEIPGISGTSKVRSFSETYWNEYNRLQGERNKK
jgi:hypothetical protein